MVIVTEAYALQEFKQYFSLKQKELYGEVIDRKARASAHRLRLNKRMRTYYP